MDIPRPLPELQREHSNSAPPAIAAGPSASPTPDDNWQSDNAEDETCRICKSEATHDQPLFYPCKCSGSIKYVHQDCLMEWLERSQKKHCELCKTPFRFTKLYIKDMPSKLPIGMFVKHMLLYALGTLRTWARGALVGMVWLVGLPWIMRHIWAVLFYIADGGWWLYPRNQPDPVLGAAINASKVAFENYATSTASPLFRAQTSSAKVLAPLNTFWKFFIDQANNNPSFANLTYADVKRALFYPAAFDAYGLPAGTRTNETITFSYPDSTVGQSFAKKPEMILAQNNDSVLSGFQFLQNLTKNKSVNRLVITILEGQMITIVVVICFILIFLIREWVVQQQPGINMGQGFNAEFAPPARDAEEDELARLRRQRDEQMEELERMIGLVEEHGRNHREQRPDVARPPTPPVERRDGDDERQGAQWIAVEEAARQTGANFRRRDEGQYGVFGETVRDGEDGPIHGLDGNGDLIPTIGATRTPTTEFLLREKSDDEKKRVVHNKILEHVRFIIPGISGKVTDLMMQEGVDEVLNYIDYEDEIHFHLIDTLLKYNKKLEEERRPLILTKDGGQNYILEALVSQMAEDHKARDTEKVVNVFMSLNLPLLLLVLGDYGMAERMVRDLDVWDGPRPDAEWVKRHDEKDSFLQEWAQHAVPENWEDEENDEEKDASHRDKEYRRKIRAKRASQDSSVYDESDEEDPYSASRPDGGVGPERARYMAKIAARAPGQSASGREEPFRFNFSGHDVEHTDSQPPRLRGGDYAGPSTMEEMQPESDSTTAEDMHTPPTPLEEREVSAEDAANGVVGYTEEGLPLISNEELMRRIEATEDDEEWTSDNEPTAYTQDEETQDDSGIQTELRMPEEIAETARLEAAAETARVEAARPQTLGAKVAHWLWGDVEVEGDDAGVDDEHIVDDINAEAPFVAVHHGHHEHHHDHDHDDDEHEHDHEHDHIQDEGPRVQEALANAGFDDLGDMDPEAIDEAEDFDGIMELVGMRGPVFGLVQNALIGIILLAITVFLGIWIPYFVGKFTLLLTANPIATIKLPLRLIFKAAAVMQDIALIFFGGCYYTFIKGLSIIFTLIGRGDEMLAAKNHGIVGLGAVDAVMYAGSALERIITDFVMAFSPDSEVPYFSAASHESLIYLRSLISSLFDVASFAKMFQVTATESGLELAPLVGLSPIKDLAMSITALSVKWCLGLPALLAKPETWVITLSSPPRKQALDMALNHWSAIDRTYAILTGYCTFIFLGAAYLRKGSPFSTSATGREWEALIIDMLNQAGGVLKVILIISIEMLVFPLYCGLLLDLATLPLFDSATLMSRLMFGLKSPFTSMFVHWFVGTCYMFHFALFVSMCRKILRKGTLYFIRDPDDPTFHPVRDVLERNIATQLRKIGFSAGVYGALVLVCLGGVVWSLAWVFKGVLPIRWSSNEPVLEFPIDLLFYNFLMPLAVKYFKPSEGLHALYTWWFIQSAHHLRLSHFLLGKRRFDEELWAAPTNPGHKVSALSKDELREIIRAQAVNPPDAAPLSPSSLAKQEATSRNFLNHGRYVRAPASDSVRIPKTSPVFLEVNSRNERLDAQPELADKLHGSNNKLFTMVYTPPYFRARIAAFIGALWLFAAVTGCGATLIPLVLGRRIFAAFLPSAVERNDVYAFAMGANLIFGALYAVSSIRAFTVRIYRLLSTSPPLLLLHSLTIKTYKIAKQAYIYTALLLLCPALLALLIEAYVILPLHAYFVPGQTHTLHVVQSWTLGLLLANLARRALVSDTWGAGGSRAALALRRVVRRGYGDLDVGLAMRAVVIPCVVLVGLALGAPLVGAWVVVALAGWDGVGVVVYRGAYPVAMALGLLVLGVREGRRGLGRWRGRVRDEVFLVGERLHNFGEGKGKGKGKAGQGRGMGSRIET